MVSVFKADRKLSGVVALTPSKSITNRILIIRKLCGEKFEIWNASASDDSDVLDKILKSDNSEINAGEAGTAYRFLTAYLSNVPGRYVLSGSGRMHQRPIAPLVEALRSIGAEIGYKEKENFPPVIINGRKLKGGKVTIDASISSQFISALLLVSPYFEEGIEISLSGTVSSEPYINMTIELMRQFGVEVVINEEKILVRPQLYKPMSYLVESDWSSASFWYVMAAFSDETSVTLNGLLENSIQGDKVIAGIMKNFGVETQFTSTGAQINKVKGWKQPERFTYDFRNCPDLAIPLIVFCAATGIPAELTGVSNLRHKESDRLDSLKAELQKMGVSLIIEEDSVQIIPGVLKDPGVLQSHNDHRITMAFAAVSMLREIQINDPFVVYKSYPEFWGNLKSLNFRLHFT